MGRNEILPSNTRMIFSTFCSVIITGLAGFAFMFIYFDCVSFTIFSYFISNFMGDEGYICMG